MATLSRFLSLHEIANAVGGELNNCDNINITIESICIDSRLDNKNGLFIPIVGDRFDGHDYIEYAYKAGAACVLSEQYKKDITNPFIKVFSCRYALGMLARYYLSLFDVKIVAITGSSGKTTTKDFLADILSKKYKIHKTKGNFNNDIGLPLTIFDIPKDIEVLILEMGMNHFGELSRLSYITRPNIAVITNIGYAHIENLGDRDGILKAKTEIFDYMDENGLIILNADDSLLYSLKKTYKNSLFFGSNINNYCSYKIIEDYGIDGYIIEINISGAPISARVNIPGIQMISNMLAAVTVSSALGVQSDSIKESLISFKTADRLEIFKKDADLMIINDVYNASPAAMELAISILQSDDRYKIAILGDMLELGSLSANLHYALGEYIFKHNIDKVICIGNDSINIYRALLSLGHKKSYYYKNVNSFMNIMDSNPDFLELTGKTAILVKASREMKFERIVKKLKVAIE